jgi:hypothetical protein
VNDGLQGLASAKGRAEYKGQNLFYEISGGLLFDGENRLKSFSLKLYGNLDFNGVNLNLDSLTAIYQAADIATGNEAKFQLLGATTINFDGNQFGLALNGDGLVITANGFQSISGKISGKLNIGGEPLDLGSLSLNYDRPLGKLRLTGKTSISKLGDQDNYIALDNVVLEIGKVAGGNGARLQRLEGNLAAGLKMSGIDFDVSNLSFAWLPDSDAFRISGKTTLKTDDKSVDLSAELLDDGITFSKNGVTFNARVNGNLVLGDSGYSVSVTNSGATYSDGKLGFQFNGNLATLLTGKDAKEEIARVQGSAYWTNSKLERSSGFASGKIGMNNAVAEFDQIGISYDGKQGAIALSGKANLSLLENGKSNNVLSVDGSISLSQSKVQEFKAKVDTGEWSPTDGITIKLVGLNVAYNSALGKFGLSGACDLKIKDDTQGISLPGDGIVWANGSFQSFNAGLTGSITLQKDTAGKRVSYLEAQNANFGFISPDSFSLGGSFKGVFGSSAGAQVTIGPGGITIDNDGIRSFDAAITAVANFGETFEDKDGDFIYNPAKDGKYNDSNANGVYDFGFGIRFQDAGLVYTRSKGAGGPSIALRGLGTAAFNSEFLSGANSKGKGIAIDLSTPGIVIADGKLTDFSFGVTTSFDLKGLTVDQASMGAQWLSSTKEMAFWGGAGVTIAGKKQGLNFGNRQAPGIRLIDGVVTEATASLAMGFSVGDLNFVLKDTGFTYSGTKNEWAIFGSASLSNIFSVSVGLGTREAPGLFIRDNDWQINKLTLALAKINLGAFSLDDASLSIDRIGGSWSVYAACGVTLPIGPGVGARGEFSLVNGKVDLISVTLASATGINIPQTPLFINYISAGIRNLSNLSQITLTGSIGIGLGTSITVFGKAATTAQFVGTCTLDPQSLRIQVDAYFGGINSGTLTKPKWKGYLAEGTGIIYLDWSRGQYYADLNLSFLSGVFITKGRFSISDINGLVFRSTAKVQIPEDVPLLGGTTLASANFLFVYNPNRSQVFAMAWGDIPFLGTYGLKYDVTPNKFSVLNDDNIKATLAKSAASNPLLMNQLATPALQSKTLLTSSLPENVSVGPMIFSMATATSIAPTWEYSGQSDSIPVTEVSEGLYQANFQVKDNSQWAKQSSQKNWIQFLIDPIDGLKIETLPLEFDAETGIGTIGVRVLPPDGQYLPRALVLRSRLQSPVELTGPGGGDPELESHWTQAYSYGGRTPPVGFDKQLNPPPEGLKVREGRFTISYRPMPDSSGRIAADWLESIRLYLDPVDSVSFKVSQPYFDAKTNKGWVVILASKDDGSFLEEGLRFTGVIRSKVALGNPEDSSGLNDGEVYPLLGIRWNTDPVVVDLPTIPDKIPSGIQTTTLTGHVNDPRIREVLVSLYFSTDYAGDQEYLTRLAANGNPAAEIPVMVNSDGSWSTEITWEASSLPKGELWLYGLAKEGITSIPVYGESAGPFQVIRPISGKVTDIKGPYAGLPVFADLNNDEIWQSNEPRSITDNDGNYALDVPKTFASTNLVYDIPAFLRPEDGLTRSHIVDLSNGPVNDNIRLLPTQSILRGSVFVTGDLNVDGWFDSLGQSVSGVGVVLSGPNGFMLRTSTNNRGQYELPVDQPGNYTLSLDLVQAEFLGFTLGEMDGISTTRHITIPNGQPDIFIQDPLRVDSIAFVTTTDPRGHGSLASLIDLANQGFVRTINFDESLRGTTIDITMAADSPPTPYYLWDSTQGKWTLVKPEVSEELRYGQTAFILDDDMRISGGDLGITLREASTATNLTEGYRAFYVQLFRQHCGRHH